MCSKGEERIGTTLAYQRDPEQHLLTFGGDVTLFGAGIVLVGLMSMTKTVHLVTCREDDYVKSFQLELH